MPTEIKPDKSSDFNELKRSRVGALMHHVTMFVIGCAIGAVLTMLYTNFLPVEQPRRMSEHRRIMTRHVVQRMNPALREFSIFAELQKPSYNERRMKRDVSNGKTVPTTTTALPPNITTAIPVATVGATTAAPGPAATAKSSAVGPATPIANTTANFNATDICPFTDLRIKTYCQIPFQLDQLGLTDIGLNDVVSSVFDLKVMNGWQSCKAGRWCPQAPSQWDVITSMAERWGNGNYQAQICPLLDCLSKLPATSYCEDEKRNLVIQTVTMLCSMPMTRETKLRDITCVKRVLMMEHRDVSDLSRANRTVARDVCGRNDSSCNAECTPLLTEFADLDLACDSYRYYVRNFGPWKWYYHSSLRQKCDVQPSINGHFSFAFIGKYRNQIVVLVTLTTIVLLIAIGVSSVFFWRRRRVVYKRAASIESEMAEMEGLLVT